MANNISMTPDEAYLHLEYIIIPKVYKKTPKDLHVLQTALDALKNQKPKTGHWIRITDKSGHLVWECDKCGWQQRFNTNYCPDCGADMREVEE